MFNKIKNRVDRELALFAGELDKLYSLRSISPLLCDSIQSFISRDGKRVRPVLFVMGYLGFKKNAPAGLYRSALSIELLHDFMLIHDDIIDKSDTRRGKPSLHKEFGRRIKAFAGAKFSGEDLALVAADVLYAISLHVFLSVQEEPDRKEAALRKIIKAALYTGSGEFLELENGLKDITRLTQEDIYKVYDLKTANYTFASPLSAGATLAGADKKEINRIFEFGIYLGRAFQIKDDILGLFEDEKKTGKSNLADIKEAKKTILVWQAFRNSGPADKNAVRKILLKKDAGMSDLLKMRAIVKNSGALDYANGQIRGLLYTARTLIQDCAIRSEYKKFLVSYAEKILHS